MNVKVKVNSVQVGLINYVYWVIAVEQMHLALIQSGFNLIEHIPRHLGL